MKKLFRYKYPKLALLILIITSAYIVFSNPAIKEIINNIDSTGYTAAFIGGLLFSFGFTTPIAIGMFIVLEPSNILYASLIGGVGAVISDIIIFKIIKFSFMDEFYRLENTKPIKKLTREIKNDFSKKVRNYMLMIFAGLIIASPLPDELGVSMLAGLTHIKQSHFIVMSYLANTLGIAIMLLI